MHMRPRVRGMRSTAPCLAPRVLLQLLPRLRLPARPLLQLQLRTCMQGQGLAGAPGR